MSRYKNFGLYASLASVVGILIRIKYPMYLGEYTEFTTVILTGLVTVGILSDPTTRNKWYRDDSQ